MSERIITYRLHGYVPLSRDRPTFALPVFRMDGVPVDGLPGLYCQVIDPPRPVVMRSFYDEGGLVKDDCNGPPINALHPYYVFLSSDDRISGPLASIEGSLKQWCSGAEKDPAIKLQIGEITGDEMITAQARIDTSNLIESFSGLRARDNYVSNSLKYESTWKILSRHALNPKSLHDLTRFRREISCHMNDSETTLFVGEMRSRVQGLISITLEEVARLIAREMPGVEITFSEDGEAAESPADVAERLMARLSVRQSLKHLSYEKWQELKIVRILSAILSDSIEARGFLKGYRTSSFHENRAIRIIRTALQLHNAETPDEVVAKLCEAIYDIWPPLRRGILLTAFSKGLRRDGPVVEKIRDITDRSRALSVIAIKRRIIFNLR